MKYINSILSLLLLCTVFLKVTPEKEVEQTTVVEPEPTVVVVPIEETILSEMSIEEKVGQLFIFGFDGTTLSDENMDFLVDNAIGGVLLLKKNILNETQLKQLVQSLQNNSKVPLFISIDQEGGVVSRIGWNKTLTTPQSEVNTSEQAYTLAKERGQILKSYGINMNLAPVVEYITEKDSFMYERVYRGTQEEVIEKSISSIKGYTDSGIISVPKHYPGHSNSSPDSHYYLPVVNISKEEWSSYIQPFSEILQQTDIDAIMVGHIKFPNIDEKPTTISYEILTNRLIEAYNYEGLLISDDMEMDALDDIDTYTNIAKQALFAGNDLLIYSKYSHKYPTIQKDVYDYIVQEVKNGNLNIDEKVLKILQVKIKYSIFQPSIKNENS